MAVTNHLLLSPHIGLQPSVSHQPTTRVRRLKDSCQLSQCSKWPHRPNTHLRSQNLEMPPGMHSAPLRHTVRIRSTKLSLNEDMFTLSSSRKDATSLSCVKQVSKPVFGTSARLSSKPKHTLSTVFSSTSTTSNSVLHPAPIQGYVADVFEDIFADAPPTATHIREKNSLGVSRIVSGCENLAWNEHETLDARYEDAVEEELNGHREAAKHFCSISQILTSSSTSCEISDRAGFDSNAGTLQYQHHFGAEDSFQDRTCAGTTNETISTETDKPNRSNGSPTKEIGKSKNSNDTNASDVTEGPRLPSCELIPEFGLVSSASLEEVRTPRRATTTPALLYETQNENAACHEAKRVVSLGDAINTLSACDSADQTALSYYCNDTSSLPSMSVNAHLNRQDRERQSGSPRCNDHLKTRTRSKCDMDVTCVSLCVPPRRHLANFGPQSNEQRRGKGLSAKDGNGQKCIKKDAHSENENGDRSPNRVSTDQSSGTTPRFSLARLSRKFRGFSNPSASASAVKSGGFSLGRLSIHLNTSTPPDENENGKVVTVIKQALSGRSSLISVLDAIGSCAGKLSDAASSALQKYLCSACCINATLSLVLKDESVQCDAPLISGLDSIGDRAKKYGDHVVQLYVSASPSVRRAFFTNTNACSRVLKFFMDLKEPSGGEADSKEISLWAWRARRLAQLLTTTLSDKVFDVTEMLSAKQGCLNKMATSFCSIPEICGFLIKLCVSDAMSLRGSCVEDESLLVGEANASGISLLEKEKVSDGLVSSFVSACDAIGCGMHSAQWPAQVSGATGSIFEMCRRVMLLPRFSENNCTYSPKFIVEVNCALGLLGLWGTSRRIGIMLDKGLEVCLLEADGKAHGDNEYTTLFGSVIKSTPLITVANHVTELLATVHRGRRDPSAAVKLAIRNGDIGPTIRCVANRGDQLLKVIESKSTCLNAKAAVVRLFAGMLRSDDTDIHGWFLGRKVAQKLVAMTRRYPHCCMLHTGVISCVRASSGQSVKENRLVCAWAKAVIRDERWKSLLDSDANAKWSFLATIVKILGEVWDTNMEEDVEMGAFGVGVCLVQRWNSETEQPCGGPKPEGPKVCILANAESLAARIHDVDVI